MRTTNGVGTFYYRDEGPFPDGSQVATSYFVLFFFPIFPIETRRIRKSNITGSSMRIDVLEYRPLAWKSILRTYVKIWLGVPLVVFGPSMLSVAGLDLASKAFDFSLTQESIFNTFAIINGIYVTVALATLLGRARRA